jgi:hypothetical protein
VSSTGFLESRLDLAQRVGGDSLSNSIVLINDDLDFLLVAVLLSSTMTLVLTGMISS